MTKCFHIIVALTLVLTGCASTLPGKDKVQTQVTKNKIPPGYIKAPRSEPPYRLRSIKLFGSGDSTKPSGPQVYDPDYAEYLEWKRWQEFKAYQAWKAKKESQAQGS